MVYREKYSVISKAQMDFKTFISLKKYIYKLAGTNNEEKNEEF